MIKYERIVTPCRGATINSKAIIAIGVVVVLAAAGIGAFAVLRDKGGDSEKDIFADAKLKVLGNVNNDDKIDSADLELIKGYVNDGKKVSDYPLADANNDEVLDDKDIAIIQDIIDKKPTKIWNVNYHDTNGDGIMDNELVETAWPHSSTIVTGSANTFMLLYLLGIVDEVKGASYGSTNDQYLFKSNYLADKKTVAEGCVKLGTSSTSIEFENGSGTGSSKVIADGKVTCVISDWNRTYLTNEKAFEDAHVDVVRVAAASFDRDSYTHSILLLGFLFQKDANAATVLKYYDDTKASVEEVVAKVPSDKKVKMAASSMNGYLSSADSDYTMVGIYAGAEFALDGFDFGGSTSIKVADNLGVYKYEDWDYILHIRTSMNYKQVTDTTVIDTINSDWGSYTAAFENWKNAEHGQFFVSGVIPVPARVAYATYAMYGDLEDVGATKAWADGLHQKFLGQYETSKKDFQVSDYTFVFNNRMLFNCKAYDGYFDDKDHPAVTITPITKGVTVQYRTSPSAEWSTTCPIVHDINTADSKNTGLKVYYRLTCEGFEAVESNVTAKVWHEKLAFTATAYTGTADGSSHNALTVTITDPTLAEHFTIKYGTSSTTSSHTTTIPQYKDAGEYKVYYSITPDATYKAMGYKTETGNVTAKITAA